MDTRELTILWVGDSSNDVEQARGAFADRGRPVRFVKASNLAEAGDRLKETVPDLIVTDARLPDGAGAQLLSIEDGEARLPVIIMTDQINEKAAVEVIKAGAMDYLLKNETTLVEMPHIVERSIREWKLLQERREARKSLRQSEARYRFLVENTLDGIFMVEVPSGTCLYLNQRICNIFGYSTEEGQQLTLWDVLSPEEHDTVRRRIDAALSGQRSPDPHQTYTMLRSDGATFPAEVSVSLVRFEQRLVLQGILRDITEQNRLQEQLRHAQKMEAVGTLAAGIAHEFNNLMQAISGYTELLMLNPKLEDAARKKMESIQSATRRASELTRQILIFGRKVENEFRSLGLNHEVRHTFKLLKKALPRMIDIQMNLDPDLEQIKGDPAYLGQMVMNLGINAREAMPEGGRLLIETRNMEIDTASARQMGNLRPGRYVQLTVSDTGHGIPREVRDHIFEPFYTTRDTTSHRGLGLAMVYGIVKEHLGHILCYSEPGLGTTFKIYLPVFRAEEKPEPPLSLPGGNETILLVDDEAFIRNFCEELLRQFGYSVLTVPDGESALAVFSEKQEQIDLVLLDLLMPGMGGKQCLRKMLDMEPSARVIIASGYAPDGELKETLSEGARGFLNKPYDAHQLLTSIRTILDQEPK